jgi:D-sedoheptulose 7-phosphate isomerase
MDHYQIISGNFQATIESIAMSVDDLAGPVSRASELMSGALLQDRKILCCGEGADATLAMLFSSNLLGHFDRDRPALPALCLTTDCASLTAIATGSGTEDIFSRQVRALGQAGDVLFCVDSAPVASDSLQRAIKAAGERGLGVVHLLRGADNSAADSTTIGVSATHRHRVVEVYTMIIHCLCELIDHNLFGPTHQET